MENSPRSRLQYQYDPPAQTLYLLYKGADPFRLLPVFAAAFPKGTAFVLAGNFTVLPKAPSPRGLARRQPRLGEFSRPLGGGGIAQR